MTCFVDTSALLAVMIADDAEHSRARETWIRLLQGPDVLVTSNYVVVEAVAILQHRLGMAAVQVLTDDVLPAMDTLWVAQKTHAVALRALQVASRRRLSLVDCVSFEVMRASGIRRVFAFDRHFREQGFTLVPGA